jgi:S1-C subfamily serine protease
VNLLDVIILALFAMAAFGGYRLGFLARIFSWAGLAVALGVANHFLRDVAAFFSESDPQLRLIAVAAYLVGAAMLGQGLGLAIGSLLHAALPLGVGLRQADQVAGAVVGGLGVFAAVWFLSPSLADVEGWTSRATRESTVVAAIDELAPQPPDSMQDLRRFMREGFLPTVFDQLDRSPNPGPPPNVGLDAATHARVVQSTVKVVGEACRRIQEGSGFAAGTNLVVTNAHVVAGERSPRVQTPQGKELAATVIVFDPNRDLAVLRVANLGQTPLAVGEAREKETGVVYGHPGGGPLRPAPALIDRRLVAIGRDIYDRSQTRREIYILGANLAPGDSGGALVDTEGVVVGVAFAIAPDRPGTSYALTDDELRPVLQAAATAGPVGTGPCLDS